MKPTHNPRLAALFTSILLGASLPPRTSSIAHAQEVPAPAPAPALADPTPSEDVIGEEINELAQEAEVHQVQAEPAPEATSESTPAIAPLHQDEPLWLREVTLRYTPADVFRAGGSVDTISKAQIERLKIADPNRLILQVPGVYVHQEDGFGLRPGIGMRGVDSNRSAKVTLMEDGVIFGPAPYSAPASYYFPMVLRMTGVEVTKGPTVVRFGPSTVSGAINFLTREIPKERAGGVDVAYGNWRSRKAHVWYGASNRWGGILVEAVHLDTAGFKRIGTYDDAAGTFAKSSFDQDTGFYKSEFMVKGNAHTKTSARHYHNVEAKLGLSRELSNETYLGLSATDFAINPNGRYEASQLDRMRWWRAQAVLRHTYEVGDHFRLETTAYRHDFQRTWRRLDRWSPADPAVPNAPGQSLLSTVAAGSSFPELYGILSAGNNSDSGVQTQQLQVVTNARRFVSTGIQMIARGDFKTGKVFHEVEAGLRLHHDEVNRLHTWRTYAQQNEMLVWDGVDYRDFPSDRPNPLLSADELNQSLALAGHAAYSLRYGGLSLTPGLRIESVFTRANNNVLVDTDPNPSDSVTNIVNPAQVRASQLGIIPALGVNYEFKDGVAVLAGVHRGFTPVSPEFAATINPENSINVEAGARYRHKRTGSTATVIGFVNAYHNILLTCDSCNPSDSGSQYSGGEATVGGVEVSGAHTFALPKDFKIPVRANYTYTYAAFSEEKVGLPYNAHVYPGDPIPYIPSHQGQTQIGLDKGRGSVTFAMTYFGSMHEGDIGLPVPMRTSRLITLDANGSFQFHPRVGMYLNVTNLTNRQVNISRRPFGARPNQPFTAMLGLKADL